LVSVTARSHGCDFGRQTQNNKTPAKNSPFNHPSPIDPNWTKTHKLAKKRGRTIKACHEKNVLGCTWQTGGESRSSSRCENKNFVGGVVSPEEMTYWPERRGKNHRGNGSGVNAERATSLERVNARGIKRNHNKPHDQTEWRRAKVTQARGCVRKRAVGWVSTHGRPESAK